MSFVPNLSVNPFASQMGVQGTPAASPMYPDQQSNPFTPSVQGAGSVPTASPSPEATQGAGTPPEPASGVVSPQPTQVADPGMAAAQPAADLDPDAILAQMDQREQASQTGENDPDAILRQMDMKEKQVSDDGHSAVFNWAAGVNKGLAKILAYPLRGVNQAVGLADIGLGKAVKALGGKDFGQVLQEAGMKAVQGANDAENNPALTTVRTVLDHIGGNTNPDPDSMAGKIGENTTYAMANIMAIQAAAPTLAAKTGMGALTIIGRSIGQAALHNPWTAIVGEVVLGTPGATLAGEATDENPTAAGLAGMAGNTLAQLVGNPIQRVIGVAAKYGVKLTSAMAEATINTVDRITSKITGAAPKTGMSPIIPDDIIDAHRAAEQHARNVGETVVQAAQTKRAAIPGTPEFEQASALLEHAKGLEAEANDAADKAWQAIPASVRSKYNQQSEAIRSEASDVVRPQVFAEEQLAGDRKIVTDRIEQALNRVKPTEQGMTSEIAAQRISEGLQDAEKMTAKMEGRLYGRVNMKQKMPERDTPLSDLTDATHEMQTKFEPQDIPISTIQRLNQVFAATDAAGKPQALPTLQRVRAIMTSLGTTRRQELATPSPNYQLVKNLSVLQTLGAKWLGDAFPDNIPLQQAREFSQFYHANFSNSDMLPFLRTTAQGGQRIRAEDVINQMFSRPFAMKDIYAAVNNVMDHPAFGVVAKNNGPTEPIMPPNNPLKEFPTLGGLADKWGPQKPIDQNWDHPYGAKAGNIDAKMLSPPYPDRTATKLFGPEDQQRLGQLSSDLENGIRSHFQEELGQVISTPKANGELPNASEIALKQQSIVTKWGDRIKSFSGVAGEVEAAMQDALKGVADRRAIENSALAKFFETKDPQNAVQKVWSSANPAALARNLISGEAGVGGFMKDPAALEGFRAALVDKLFAQGRGDPRAIQRILSENPKLSRLMNVALGGDRMDRLDRIMSNLVATQDQAHSKWAEFWITGARLASLKLSAMLPKIGEGAELMQASIFSQTAKKAVMGILHKDSAEVLLKDAIRNPAAERMLLQSGGGNWKTYHDAMRDINRDKIMLRRVLRMGDGLIQAYNATQSNEDGPGPVDHRPSIANSNIGAPRE